jgi:hypothetical protein
LPGFYAVIGFVNEAGDIVEVPEEEITKKKSTVLKGLRSALVIYEIEEKRVKKAFVSD